MKSEILSSSVIQLTGACPTRAVVQALEPYSKGSLRWEVPPAKVPEGLVPPALLALALRAPIEASGAVEVPSALWTHLFPYQREGVLRVVHQFRGRCLLADEMGLGKTLQAIACMLHFGVPTLVVCPAFLCTNWRRTLEQWGASATVCSYGKVPAGDWGMVVADEAHYLKSRESQRAQTILPLLLAAPYALLLTGTPCPNRPEELFTLMHALRPTLAPDFTSFAARYCNPRRTPFCAYDTRGSDRPAELKWLLQRAFEVRRTKAEVLPQLPDKLKRMLYVDIDPASRAEMACLRGKLDAAIARGSRLAQTLTMEMYRATAHAKAQEAAALVAARVQPGAVIFAHHQVVLDAMQQALPTVMRVGRIDGRTSLVHRQRVVDGMQSGQLDVALLSMGAAGVGLTLTRATVAYFLEIPWCPAVLRQCEDRIHRIGQERSCTVYYVIAEDTLDPHVWNSIHRKERVAERIGQG
jgi:SWI/SNF-related matrix-associated actin-dependent regulator 1 of chromatin subfamily A